MVKCPNCKCRHSKVTHTYSESTFSFRNKTYTVIKRRRQCFHCKTAWYTIERNEEDIIMDEHHNPK